VAATRTTRTTSTGSGASSQVSLNLIEVLSEDEAYQLARELHKLIQVSTFADTTATALRLRVINQLRDEGLDGAGRLAFLLGTDATRAADRVVAPLRAIQSDMENAARSAVVFQSRIQNTVFEPIRMARARRNGGTAGLDVN
jgi:hypothetical protein